MSAQLWKGVLLSGLSIALGLAGGYWYASSGMGDASNATAEHATATQDGRKVLYWYDPMSPQQKFDKPGKSPFMDMELLPKYADEGADSTSISIDPSLTQNLGLRLATVTRGPLTNTLDVVGVLALNEREVAVVQARAGGFVERVYARAPGDVLKAGAPLVDLLIPDWAAAQEEFLALKHNGDASLLAAARQRLQLLGMPPTLISQVERGGKSRPVLTLSSPIGGVIQELDVRAGMTVAAGTNLARINGLSSVWLSLAVPESEAGSIAQGQAVEARLPAFPGEVLAGTVDAILPETNPDSRTLRVRVELPNPDGRLRPGLTAQVRLNRSSAQSVLWVSSEAVMRTGRRALVMLAEDGGRYRPVEVRLGPESAGRTVVTQGLTEGQQVVASGQFLLDSEASLKGLTAPAESKPTSTSAPVRDEADAQVTAIDAASVTLAHGPFETVGMPGMTMAYPLADPTVMVGIKAGDKVRVTVRQTDSGLVVERLEKLGGQP
ncbi:efflux RND transporter periplasmic adaptor subunit [Pseudomonas sp. BN414]|uniref:efflux RND transporter periplasmic adaptor subunit n=1 Tax=Pseudomonas sp. BN414 TaxID=2567888 RepID=UPI002456B727|nr:efflux RND transporter periplasmic adaptor subunit [Pseudomonas sp. BN414]MDH4570493.1 efflux RND transporter periplasmic adaptor subunit [Pseudomonas sp. BN414]